MHTSLPSLKIVEEDRRRWPFSRGMFAIRLTDTGCKGVWLRDSTPLLKEAFDEVLRSGSLLFCDGGFLRASESAFNVALTTSVARVVLSWV